MAQRQVVHTLKIILHNVNSWMNKKNELTNYYLRNDADIVLLNSTAVKESNSH